jgi:hypothetical protein
MASISARAELSQFVVECLLRLDPTLNVSAGSRVYTTVVEPLLNRLGTDPMSTDVETFVQQRMLDVYPEMDTQTPGSAIRDILVTPLVLLLTPFRAEIAHLRRQNSLADYETLTESEMDALLANVLSSRATGDFAYGYVRIFFASARTVGVDASIVATSTTGVKCIVDEVRTYLSSEMTRQGNQWYLEVPVRSATPSASANMPANTQFTITGIDGVIRCYNPSAISGGIAQASNTDFYASSQEELTERSLNTERGIRKFISENTSGVVSVDVVGFGDPLMQRDVLTADAPLTITGIPGGVPFPGVLGTSIAINPNEVHVGGATDIYVKTGSPSADVLAGLVVTDDALLAADIKACSITAGSTTVTSTGLGTALGYIAAPVAVDDYVLEFENFVGITPVAVRIVAATGANTVRVETAFAGFAGVLAAQRARLVDSTRVYLPAPKKVLQVGTLTTSASSKVVALSSGVVFSNSPASEAIYVEITFAGVPTEYRATSVGAAEITLDRVPSYVGAGYAYRVYLKQAGALSLPLLQTTRTYLADGDTGVEVPYRDPVSTNVAASAARRSTPLLYDQLGPCTFAADVFACTGHSFVELGVQEGDVVVVPEANAAAQYSTVLAVLSATSLQLSNTAAAPVTSVAYRVGTAPYSTATLTFMDPTYLEVSSDTTLLTYEDSTGVEHLYKPNASVDGYLYNPTEIYTEFYVDLVLGTTVNTAVDVLQLGARAGDVLSIQRIVLQSAVFSDADELLLDLDGKALSATIDGRSFNVYFPNTTAMWHVQDAVTYLNQQLGTELLAERVHTGVNLTYLYIYARKHVVLTNLVGAPLAALRISTADNAFPGFSAGNAAIASINAAGTQLTLAGTIEAAVLGVRVMVAIQRPGSQFVFPANMVQLDNGLYSASIDVEGITPFTAGAIPSGAEFVCSGYRALGHSFYVANPEFSFSTGEQVYIDITPLVLPPTATSMLEALTTPQSLLTIEYEHAPEVASLQSTFLRPSSRVTCNSPLLRHHFPAYPVTGIRYSGSAVEADVEAALLAFFVRLYPNLPLEAYDVSTVLSKLDILDVEGPLEVGYLTLNKSRLLSLSKSLNRVDLDRSFHVMGELDYVVVSKG